MNTAGISRIRYLSPPAPVSMADDWYGIATLGHFWMKRRFDVLCGLTGNDIRSAIAIADVGCGHGILQRQIEDHFQREVTGFDLNEVALKQTVSRTSAVCCYDVFQREPSYDGRFDLVLIFDVLEHLEDEQHFIRAIRFHMTPGGRIVVNVPAMQSLWSRYDEAAGHFRRYDIATLNEVASQCGLTVRTWSYWGFPLTPLLIGRKIWLSIRSNGQTISEGFSARGNAVNRMLFLLSRCERIPQHFFGSSLMAVFEVDAGESLSGTRAPSR
jgi:SAM-dependent methyltransferase